MQLFNYAAELSGNLRLKKNVLSTKKCSVKFVKVVIKLLVMWFFLH